MTETQNNSNSSSTTPYLDMQAKLLSGQAAMAMNHLNLDRCLLRRDMVASQNQQYGLSQDNLPENCEDDDMGVQVGDNVNEVVHNHYHNEQSSQPVPCPRSGWLCRCALQLRQVSAVPYAIIPG